MSKSRIGRLSAANLFRNCALFLCLIAPSVWMIGTVPPLWRDADAYVQLTQHPVVVTFWGHAPAYSYVTKPLLFAGEQWERWWGSLPARSALKSSQPGLTDTGIWLVVITQHLALAAALFFFIRAVSQIFWVRLALALVWVVNPLFPAYAHCLGSETLGMILSVVVATKGLRLIQDDREPGWMDWYLFAVALFFCILSRDLNLGLVALLPATFLIAWTWNRVSVSRVASESERLRFRQLRGRFLRHAVIAIVLGVACIAVGSSLEKNLARKTRLNPHSRIGFTFLWRLNFLDDLSPEARNALLQKVSARTHSTRARQVIALIGQMHAEKADMSSGPFMHRAILLFNGPQWEELDRALNEMALAFLLPPTPEHLQAFKTDLIHALTMPTTEITNYLFATTTYYFEHKSELPGCANLVTFRGASREQIMSIPSQHGYFRLWHGLSYSRACLIWLLALAAFVVIARRRRIHVSPVIAFGAALTAVGLLIGVTACVLHELEPRFALSMWQLLLLSLCLFLGKTANLLASPPR
jgi:hypothetical protein